MNNSRDIFISYCHRDQKWLDRLSVHLKAVERAEAIASFSDTIIRPGAQWRDEIRHAIETAKVAVVLISADFLASDFIRDHELPPLLAAAQKRGTVIMPIVVSPSLFDQTEDLSRYQSLNPPGRPLIAMNENEQELLFVHACKAIIGAVQHFVPKDQLAEEENLTTAQEAAEETMAEPAPEPAPDPIVSCEPTAPTRKAAKSAKRATGGKRPPKTEPKPRTRRAGASVSAKSIHATLAEYRSRDESIFVKPKIPPNKLQNAREAFDVPADEDVLGLIDCTVFGSAKTGMIFATNGVYGFNDWASTITGKFKIDYKSFSQRNFKLGNAAYEVSLGKDVIFNCAGGPNRQLVLEIMTAVRALFTAKG